MAEEPCESRAYLLATLKSNYCKHFPRSELERADTQPSLLRTANLPRQLREGTMRMAESNERLGRCRLLRLALNGAEKSLRASRAT